MVNSTALAGLQAKLADLLIEAFDLGKQVGAAAMREAILQAAAAPDSQTVATSHPVAAETTRTRAPKGELRHGIVEAMRHMPAGIRELDIPVMARRLGIEINAKSVGGELRRMRGSLYQQTGGKWFLIGRKAETGTADSTESAATETTEGDSDGTSVAA